MSTNFVLTCPPSTSSPPLPPSRARRTPTRVEATQRERLVHLLPVPPAAPPSNSSGAVGCGYAWRDAMVTQPQRGLPAVVPTQTAFATRQGVGYIYFHRLYIPLGLEGKKKEAPTTPGASCGRLVREMARLWRFPDYSRPSCSAACGIMAFLAQLSARL